MPKSRPRPPVKPCRTTTTHPNRLKRLEINPWLQETCLLYFRPLSHSQLRPTALVGGGGRGRDALIAIAIEDCFLVVSRPVEPWIDSLFLSHSEFTFKSVLKLFTTLCCLFPSSRIRYLRVCV